MNILLIPVKSDCKPLCPTLYPIRLGSRLQPLWNGFPVPVNDGVDYVCRDSDLRFDLNRSLGVWQGLIRCGDHGRFTHPTPRWPNCVRTVYCGEPPQSPKNAFRDWIDGDFEYGSKAVYKCGKYGKFNYNDGENDGIITQEVLQCEWAAFWTSRVLHECVCKLKLYVANTIYAIHQG